MKLPKLLGYFLALAGFAVSGCAQLPSGAGAPSTIAKDTTIRVRVSYDNARGVPSNARVALLSWYGSTVEVRTTDGYGNVELAHVLPGKYKLVVSGLNIQTTETGQIEVADGTPYI